MTAIVIGAGVNELVAAHFLARAGRPVLVLDASGSHDNAVPDTGWIPPQIVRDLALAAHGLEIQRADPWASAPLPDGSRLELWHDMARSVDAIRRVSPRDAAKWPEFCARMARLARLLETLYAAPPPDPLTRERAELVELAAFALRTRRLGREAVADLLRSLPISVADLLDDWFENDVLKGILGAGGVRHLQQGPRSSGTSFLLLHQHVGSPAGVFRPPRSNIARVLAGMPGIEIRRNAPVARIIVREGRAAGVVLARGEEIAATLVLSGADPRRTLSDLVDTAWLDPKLVRAVRSIRARGVAAHVTLELDRAADFETLVVAPSLDYLERAYDDAKHGRVSRAPYLEARRAAANRVDVHVQYAPYALAEGAWDQARGAALADRVAELLAPHLPPIAGRSALSPRDLEHAHGWPEGQPHQAELTLDQALWMRPLPGLARYATPIEGLYLCGSGMHPGGGIAGAAGANAAGVILRRDSPRRA
jgi:phytoene dehydrogenase-like protein